MPSWSFRPPGSSSPRLSEPKASSSFLSSWPVSFNIFSISCSRCSSLRFADSEALALPLARLKTPFLVGASVCWVVCWAGHCFHSKDRQNLKKFCLAVRRGNHRMNFHRHNRHINNRYPAFLTSLQCWIEKQTDAFVLIPNHLHGIVTVGAIPCDCPGQTVAISCNHVEVHTRMR